MPRNHEVDRAITETLSSYVSQRDNFRTNVFTGGKGKLGQAIAFNEMINASAMSLFNNLPPMNLAEMEAFAELANSRLNYIRMMNRPGPKPVA